MHKYIIYLYNRANCPTYILCRLLSHILEKGGDAVKEKAVYSLDLTIKNNTQTGFKCRHEAVGCREVAKAVKALYWKAYAGKQGQRVENGSIASMVWFPM